MATEDQKRRFDGRRISRIAVGTVVISCLLGWLFYPDVTHAERSVFFLRSTMPWSTVSDQVDAIESLSDPAQMITEPVVESFDILDQEQQIVEMLMKEDFEAAYDRLEDKEHWQTVRMRVTGYCSCPKCCGKFSDGKTASNHHIHKGDVFVAADKFYSFGTEMVIPGYNYNNPVTVQDRGRVIKGNRLDLYFDTHRQAQKWGVKYLDVLVKVEE